MSFWQAASLEPTARAPFVVLGLGNELFTDEGIGVAAARRLAARHVADTEVVDGGTLGIALLPTIEDRAGLILLDAMAAEGATAGDVLVLDGSDLPTGQRLLLSAHQVGIGEALAAAELAGRAPRRVAAVGMVPAVLEVGYGISPTASSQLDRLIEAALAILEEWGKGRQCMKSE